MFVDEDQWARAFKAAKNEVDTLYAQGLIDVPTGKVNGTLHRAAVAIATAALRAAALDGEGDIGDVAGVHIDEMHPRTPRRGLTPDLVLIDDDPFGEFEEEKL